jgi:hypothetical protein
MILDELRKVQRLRGDTYSSYEIVGLIGRAADEIELLLEKLKNLIALQAALRAEHEANEVVMRAWSQMAVKDALDACSKLWNTRPNSSGIPGDEI